MEHALRQFLGVGVAFGDSSPEEHADLIGIPFALQGIHDLSREVAAARIGFHVELFVPFIRVGIGAGGSELKRTERAGVDVALHFENPTDESGVGGEQTDAPAGHVVALAHGVELDATVFGTGDLQDAQMFFSEDETVGVVVHNHDAVAAGEIHQFLVGLSARGGSGRHVGIVAPEEFHSFEVHVLQFLKVRLPVVLGSEIIVHHLAAEEAGERGVGRIAGIRDEHLLAGIDEGEGGVENALFGADERLDFSLGVQ